MRAPFFAEPGRHRTGRFREKLEEDIASVPVLALVQEKIRTAGEEESIHASRDGFASGRLLSRLGIWLVYCYPNQVVEKPLRFFRIFNAALTILVVALLGAYAFYAGKSFARPLGRILQAMEDKQDKNSFLIQEKGRTSWPSFMTNTTGWSSVRKA